MAGWRRRQGAALFTVLLFLGACGTTQTPAPSGQTQDGNYLAKIKDRGELRVAFVSDPGYAYIDEATGKWAGVEWEIAQYMADVLKVKLVPVESEYSNVVAQVQSGRADLAIPGLYATPERALAIWFSIPYRVEGEVLLMRKEDVTRLNSDEAWNSPDVTIAVVTGSAATDPVKKAFPKAKILDTDSSGGYLEVQAGRADGFIVGTTSAAKYLAQFDWPAVYPSNRTLLGGTDLVAGLPFGAADLQQFVNTTIEYMKTQGTLDALHRKYGLGFYVQPQK
jgi:polar amino acid transport system substrate-binding protein